ncbi:hypothetical protein BDR26DRAFT_870214, partial [Obelidium mucronatum]
MWAIAGFSCKARSIMSKVEYHHVDTSRTTIKNGVLVFSQVFFKASTCCGESLTATTKACSFCTAKPSTDRAERNPFDAKSMMCAQQRMCISIVTSPSSASSLSELFSLSVSSPADSVSLGSGSSSSSSSGSSISSTIHRTISSIMVSLLLALSVVMLKTRFQILFSRNLLDFLGQIGPCVFSKNRNYVQNTGELLERLDPMNSYAHESCFVVSGCPNIQC